MKSNARVGRFAVGMGRMKESSKDVAGRVDVVPIRTAADLESVKQMENVVSLAEEGDAAFVPGGGAGAAEEERLGSLEEETVKLEAAIARALHAEKEAGAETAAALKAAVAAQAREEMEAAVDEHRNEIAEMERALADKQAFLLAHGDDKDAAKRAALEAAEAEAAAALERHRAELAAEQAAAAAALERHQEELAAAAARLEAEQAAAAEQAEAFSQSSGLQLLQRTMRQWELAGLRRAFAQWSRGALILRAEEDLALAEQQRQQMMAASQALRAKQRRLEREAKAALEDELAAAAARLEAEKAAAAEQAQQFSQSSGLQLMKRTLRQWELAGVRRGFTQWSRVALMQRAENDLAFVEQHLTTLSGNLTTLRGRWS